MQKYKVQIGQTIIVCGLLLLIAVACDASNAITEALTAVSPATTQNVPVSPTPPPILRIGYSTRDSFYELYFTDPLHPDAERQEGGLDAPLAQAIDEARVSVDLAAYSLSLRSIRDALLRAHRRGVPVRLVMERDNMENTVPTALVDAGIQIIGDNREGLMHDKFVIIDRSEVWTGSMNFTASGTYEDNNNLIRIRSTKVAENYTVEFEEMFERDFFGQDAIARTPNSHVTIDEVEVEVYFSPDDKVARRIVELLRGAQRSITFMAFSFTADDFSDILLQKAEQGLTIAGVMEEQQVKSNQGTEFTTFQDAKLPVYLDGNEGQMHHKVFIIDEQIVITGSYNFSFSAETLNDENVVIFFDPQIAAQYLAEFKRIDAQVLK